MILRKTGVSIVVGLLAIGTLAGAREAWAGSILITASGGLVTGTDPFYYYDFDVSLAPGSQWVPNYFMIEGLPGITPPNPPRGNEGNNLHLPSPGSTSSYSGPYNFGPPVITLTDGSSPFSSNVEWLNTTSTTFRAGTDGLFLGSFFVETSVSLRSLPKAVTYIASSNGSSGNFYSEGQVTIQPAGIPEPSAIVLFLSGTGLLSLVLLGRRRGLSACPRHST